MCICKVICICMYACMYTHNMNVLGNQQLPPSKAIFKSAARGRNGLVSNQEPACSWVSPCQDLMREGEIQEAKVTERDIAIDVYMSICIHVYRSVCIYIHVCIHISISIYIYIYIYIYIHI